MLWEAEELPTREEPRILDELSEVAELGEAEDLSVRDGVWDVAELREDVEPSEGDESLGWDEVPVRDELFERIEL